MNVRILTKNKCCSVKLLLNDMYRRHAVLARLLAMVQCPPVCVCDRLTQIGVLLNWMDGSSLFLARRLLSTYPTLCCNEIQVGLSTKIRVLRSGSLFIYLFIMKFIQLGTQIKTRCEKKYTKIHKCCVLNSGHKKIRQGKSIAEMCYQLGSTKVDAQGVINWTVVGQLS